MQKLVSASSTAFALFYICFIVLDFRNIFSLKYEKINNIRARKKLRWPHCEMPFMGIFGVKFEIKLLSYLAFVKFVFSTHKINFV